MPADGLSRSHAVLRVGHCSRSCLSRSLHAELRVVHCSRRAQALLAAHGKGHTALYSVAGGEVLLLLEEGCEVGGEAFQRPLNFELVPCGLCATATSPPPTACAAAPVLRPCQQPDTCSAKHCILAHSHTCPCRRSARPVDSDSVSIADRALLHVLQAIKHPLARVHRESGTTVRSPEPPPVTVPRWRRGP